MFVRLAFRGDGLRQARGTLFGALPEGKSGDPEVADQHEHNTKRRRERRRFQRLARGGRGRECPDRHERVVGPDGFHSGDAGKGGMPKRQHGRRIQTAKLKTMAVNGEPDPARQQRPRTMPSQRVCS